MWQPLKHNAPGFAAGRKPGMPMTENVRVDFDPYRYVFPPNRSPELPMDVNNPVPNPQTPVTVNPFKRLFQIWK